MGAVFSYSQVREKGGKLAEAFQSLMGAVFSYSARQPGRTPGRTKFQSLMGAVFSYSSISTSVSNGSIMVSIPDGCSVQL